MRRTLVLLSMLLAVGMMATPAMAGGPDAETLAKAGWFCFDEGEGTPTHCLPPPQGQALFVEGATPTSLVILAFGPNGEFLGTELLLHEDVYNGQPCPQDHVDDGDGTYIDLRDEGLPYFVCHHFESEFT